MMKGAQECRTENRLTQHTKLDQSAILVFASAMFPHSRNESHAQLRSTLRLQAQPSCFSPNLHGVEPKSLATLENLAWEHRRISGFWFTPPKAGNLSVFLGKTKIRFEV